MKVRVVNPFFDKFNLSRQYNPGEVVDFDENRANNIVERGLGEFIKEIEPNVEKSAEVVIPDEPVEKAEESKESQSVAEEPKKRGRRKKAE